MIVAMLVFRTLILSLVWLLMAAPAVFADPDVYLQLKDVAEIASRTYHLGDIVVQDGLGGRLKRQLVKVPIGRTPRPGQWTQVTRFEVSAALEKAVPGVAGRLQWGGPAFIRIRGGGVLCDMKALQQAAHHFILDRLQEKYDHVAINPVGEMKPVITAAGKISFHPKMPSDGRLQKRMAVWVDVFVDDRHFQTVPFWFDVSVYMPVWVVREKIGYRRPITENNVEHRLLDIAGLSGEPVTDRALGGIRAVRKLPVDTILTLEDVEPVPAVSQGEVITINACHGAVQLHAKAVALMDGRVSELIEVRNPSSGKTFRVKVTGIKQAVVN